MINLFVNEKESWNRYCELAVDSYCHENVSGIGVWKLAGDSYGHGSVSGNWSVTAMDRCLETGR